MNYREMAYGCELPINAEWELKYLGEDGSFWDMEYTRHFCIEDQCWHSGSFHDWYLNERVAAEDYPSVQDELDLAHKHMQDMVRMYHGGMVTLREFADQVKWIADSVPADLTGCICPNTGLKY